MATIQEMIDAYLVAVDAHYTHNTTLLANAQTASSALANNISDLANAKDNLFQAADALRDSELELHGRGITSDGKGLLVIINTDGLPAVFEQDDDGLWQPYEKAQDLPVRGTRTPEEESFSTFVGLHRR